MILKTYVTKMKLSSDQNEAVKCFKCGVETLNRHLYMQYGTCRLKHLTIKWRTLNNCLFREPG